MTSANATVIPFSLSDSPFSDEERRTRRRSSSSSSTTTTITPAPARDNGRNAAKVIEKLCEYYCESFDRTRCPETVRTQIIDALKQGMHATLIITIMDAAQDAPRPSWAYAKAIMFRCLQEDCKDLEAWKRREVRHHAHTHYGESQADFDEAALDLPF